jgi:tRNA-Thr(GGU) m(6)t(6)A37 methyltransferase TsaA
MTVRPLHALLIAAVLCSGWLVPAAAEDQGKISKKEFIVYPVGEVKKEAGSTKIVMDPKFQPGLLGLNKVSHIHVLYWFDRNDTPQERAILQVHPRGKKSNPLSGVFATRAPVRPNLIALSLCRILSVRKNVVEIEDIDAFHNTPVLDIKPYIETVDTVHR